MPRRLLTIEGIVQGVGFRPFVYTLATRLGLTGFVRNDGGSVVIEVEGDDAVLDEFQEQISRHAPRHSHVQQLRWRQLDERRQSGFSILPSQQSAGSVLIAPDIATCHDCLRELNDPADRRCGYPFLNCTHCGPRLTIVTSAPYDRPRTTMTTFPLCAACQHEYTDASDRRFHAQPIACPACGPSVCIIDKDGNRLAVADPIPFAARALRHGQIVAIKGMGGYHLACDARDESAIAELRRRKSREAKPLAIMLSDLTAVRALCELSELEEQLLTSPAAPIVILKRRPRASVAVNVAPGNPYLGVLLPYMPLQYLLMAAAENIPLVMTSGNQSEEPIAFDDASSAIQLSSIVDFSLSHDRPIHIACDDSVARIVLGQHLLIRRSRGYAPAPIELPLACPVPLLALGGQLKSTFALGIGQQAILSHHLGDLEHYRAYQNFVDTLAHYERLFAVDAEIIVHDLHPDYLTTRYAQDVRADIPRIAVQHHHAHLASCLAEHGLLESAIGVVFDGTGYGSDGQIWGGEFLIGDCHHFRRAAHLRYVPLPGGEMAIRQPWRMAAAHLLDAGCGIDVLRAHVDSQQLNIIGRLILGERTRMLTSSAGRLFDGVAALIGLRTHAQFEGQAAMELEWLATDCAAADCAAADVYPFELTPSSGLDPVVIDTRPLITAIIEDVQARRPASLIARRFHTTLAQIIVAVCQRLREHSQLNTVALSGGVFMNALLVAQCVDQLAEAGFRVFRQQQVPPNDGGLCLGQLTIAAATCARNNAR